MKIYLGIDNNTQEYVLINWNGTIQELEKKEDCAGVLWHGVFNNWDDVNKFLDNYDQIKNYN